MKLINLIILLIVVFFQYGCFEIVEEISLKKNGSGTFKYTINFSQSTSKIKSLMLLEEVEGYKVPTEKKIHSEFDKLVVLSKKINGISNVKDSLDFNNYIFVYSCDFKHVENLNTIIDSLNQKSKSVKNNKTNYFSYSISKKIFSRKGDDVLKQLYNKMTDSQQRIFIGADYTALYRFENEIKEVSEPNAKISANKKAVLHQLKLLILTQRGEAINKIINLK